MGFDWYADDDVTPAGTANDLSTTAGTASAAVELHAWLNKGSSVGDPETRYLRLYVEDPDSPGTYLTSGLDVLDRREVEVRIIGSQNPDLVPEFVVSPTAWKALGTGRVLQLPAIYPNCCIEIEIRENPTYEGGASSPFNYYLKAVQGTAGDTAEGGDAPSGVLPGLGCETVTECVLAPTVANDTDKITLGPWAQVMAGKRFHGGGGDVTLDQDDGASAALGSGEEYKALISVAADGALTTTKSVKALAGAAVLPSLPAGHAAFVSVTVPYGGVITSSTLLAVSGRFVVADTTGLVVSIGPGRGLYQGTSVANTATQYLTLPDDTTSTVYVSAAGTANIVSGIPLATVVTASGDISSVTDIRRILRPLPIKLTIPGDESVAADLARQYIPFPWTVDRGWIECGTPSTGATGTTQINLSANGGQFTADGLDAQGTGLECNFWQTTHPAGWLRAEIATITSGGTRAANFDILLWIFEV